MKRPALRTQIADRANAVVWRLPLPRRPRVFLSQMVYRNPPMPAERVVEVVDALTETGVETILIGGWGIDALTGRQLRPHGDLDLIVDESSYNFAATVLQRMGYRPWNRNPPGPIGELEHFSLAHTFRDSALRVVELHAVELANFETEIGRIGGSPIPCLAAKDQMRAQRLVGRNWTPGRRLKHHRNVAALRTAIQQGTQNL